VGAAAAVRWGSFTSRNSEETTERGFANFVLAGIKKKPYWPKEGLALEIPFYIFFGRPILCFFNANAMAVDFSQHMYHRHSP